MTNKNPRRPTHFVWDIPRRASKLYFCDITMQIWNIKFPTKRDVRKLLTLFPHILAHYNDLFNEILVVESGSNIFTEIKICQFTKIRITVNTNANTNIYVTGNIPLGVSVFLVYNIPPF